MEPRIETRSETLLVGMCNVNSTPGMSTAQLWQRFMPRRGEIKARTGGDFISMRVFHRNGEPFSPATPFDEWAVVEVSDLEGVPEAMQSFTLPRGDYAVFIHHGPLAAFPRTAQYIFGTWLPGSEYELDDRPHLAVMGPNYRPDDPDAEEEIWIPVREKRERSAAN